MDDNEYEEPHNITAMYDNMYGMLLCINRSAPTLQCSCGYRGHGETWEEAGIEFDYHLEDLRRATE